MNTMRAALYARISQDDTGEKAGVQRQLTEARAHAERKGWEVVAEFSDNDISAFKGKERPGYQALLDEVRAGRVDRVVVFHSSRLWRNIGELAQGVDLFNAYGAQLVETSGAEFDTKTATGFMNLGLAGLMNSWESRVKSERVTAAARDRALKGQPNGALPYGWRRVEEFNERGMRVGARDVLDPEQAPVVEAICRRLLAGESLIGVTRWLNESGIQAPGAKFDVRGRGRGLENPDGELWGKTSVKKIALRSQNCGMRQYHKGRPDEELLPLNAEPIITEDEWQRLRAILTAPERRTTRDGNRKHLLSYSRVGQCGVCGAPLRVHTVRSRFGKPQVLYTCAKPVACVGRNRDRVDELVRGVVVARLSREDARDLLVRDDVRARGALERAAGLEARLATAADEYADGNIDAAQLRRITERLRPQIEAAHAEAQASQPDVPLALLTDVAGPDAGERWDALTIVQQKALVGALFERVAILRREKRGPGFEPETVELVWRGTQNGEQS